MGHHTPASRWGCRRRHRRAIQRSRGSKVRRAEGTMESEPGAPASTAGSTGTISTTSSSSTSTPASTSTSSSAIAVSTSASTSTTTGSTTSGSSISVSSSSNSSGSVMSSSSSNSTSAGRQAVRQISIYSEMPDRQTVQVFQQALHRQPNTAAQYLQQMYAAQQQHLMLQTAALQQHSLSTAQLQSLAAVQQASIAAGRQSSSQNGTSSQQTGSTQATINLTTSPAAAQLISRAQNISSTPTSISQQAVLLGSQSTLTPSQAQMYLRQQMAQQSNLVQVARSLSRAVPLSPQLIFTPAATVTAVQSESTTQASSQNQVQNLAIRGQQGATTSSSQTQTLPLSLKQSPVPIQPASLIKNPSQGTQTSSGVKSSSSDSPPDGGKKGDGQAVTEVRAINMSRSITAVSAQPLIAPAYTQIQPHSLVQQHKQQQQFVVQQSQGSQRTTGQLLQTASIQPSQHPVPVLPKPAPHQPSAPSQQATIFHSTLSSHALHSPLNQAKAQPVQLTAINLQIQPATSRPVQDSKDKPTSLVVRETSQTPSTQQQQQQQQQQQRPASSPSQPFKPGEQPKVNAAAPSVSTQGGSSAKRPITTPGTPPPAMTSGNESEAPTVTGSTPQNGENKPPQAIVKPQVLTHVIEGFVIQEGAEPFPVCVERLPILIDSPKKLDHQLSSDPDKTPVSNAANTDSEPEDMNQPEKEEPKLTCEYCGWVDFAYTFKGSKRFCSVVCAKRYNVGCTKRVGLFRPEKNKTTNRWRKRPNSRSSIEAKKQKMSPPRPQQTQGGSISSPHASQPSQEESSPCSDMSSYEEPPSPMSAASSGPRAPAPASVQVPVRRQPSRTSEPEACAGRDDALLNERFLPNDPTKWNVEEVYEFIRSLPGCQEIADEFRSQEIDGQALLLLKEDHLMSTMNIKLGPALKIFARINMLKDS
ncbi:polyhomeotic-like protein 2b isoform X2 [Poeciliopsis prolifica]|uniref:polyhomeotic-like protein 2b isoform X2 n=1 Tax=Poeciliopsis prolifica TaxID=188132 RepID=UPI00241319D3|nr:polyhomeotic-like protein 2b isoform X2 [Poeciliopsis prolifica]